MHRRWLSPCVPRRSWSRAAITEGDGQMRLKGKSVVITGAASGIGRATAIRFAAEGARLVIADRNETRLDEVLATVRNSGGSAVSAVGDISRKEVAEALIDQAVAAHGRIDVLVN